MRGNVKNKKYRFQKSVVAKYQKRIDTLMAATRIEDLFVFNSLNFEALYSVPPALIGICNPDVYNIRIFNPLIALQMLIFYACGLQIRTSTAAII